MRTTIVIVGLILFVFAACEREEIQRVPDPPLEVRTNTPDRFELRLMQRIEDRLAYGRERRIYVLVDRASGKEFVGISGIGIAETGQHSTGKVLVQDER